MTQRILIADDEPNILISLEYLMKREGYEVHVARDGEEALEALRRVQPALVLLDDDAEEDRLRGLPGAARRRSIALRVLMLTAKGRDTDVAKGLASAPTPT